MKKQHIIMIIFQNNYNYPSLNSPVTENVNTSHNNPNTIAYNIAHSKYMGSLIVLGLNSLIVLKFNNFDSTLYDCY